MADFFVSAVFLSYFLIILLMTLISFNVTYSRGVKRLAWRVSNVAASLSFASYLLPPMQPDIWRQTIINLLVVLTGLSAAYAVLLQVKPRLPLRLYAAVLAPLLLFVLYFLSVETDVRRRLLVVSIFVLLLAVYLAAELGVTFLRRRRLPYLLLFMTFLVAAGGYTARTFWIATATGVSDVELRATAVVAGTAVNMFVFVGWNLIFYTLIIDDATQQLHASEDRLLEANSNLEQQVAERTVDLQTTVEELKMTAAELRRANAGKDAFLAATSHELRTPLTAILSLSELLGAEVRGPLNKEQARYVVLIQQGGQRLTKTVDSILLYTSLMAGKYAVRYESCRLAELSAAAIRSVQAAAEQKRQVITEQIAPRDLTIQSDPEGILQLFKILLDNAVKFTPEEGRIGVNITPVCTAEGVDCMQIIVSDTGIGISDDQIATIFSAFTQGDMALSRRFEGLGLGLAYAQRLCELLDGSISVHSILGQGSSFTLLLPCSPPSHQPEDQQGATVRHA